LCPKMKDYAAQLLCNFVSEVPTIYGEDFKVYNIHSLLHLKDDVDNFGILDNFSCFQFENRLGHIKRLLRSGNHPLAQLNRRKAEIDSISLLNAGKDDENDCTTPGVKYEHLDGPNFGISGRQFKQIKYSSFMLDITKPADCYALDNNHRVFPES